MVSASASSLCVVLLVLSKREVAVEGATVTAVSPPAQKFQLGTLFGGSFFVTGTVIRNNSLDGSPRNQGALELAFVLPNRANCYFLKSKWRATSATVYISMQLECNPPLSLTEDYYLDREKLKITPYPKNSSSTFGPLATDARLFISSCCCCGTDSLAVNTIYWNFDSQNYAVVLVALADRTLGFKTIRTYGQSYKPLCDNSGLLLYAYPSTSGYSSGQGQAGQAGQAGQSGAAGASGPYGQSGASGPAGFSGVSSSIRQLAVATCPGGPVKLPRELLSTATDFVRTAEFSVLQDSVFPVVVQPPAAFPQSYYDAPEGLRPQADLYSLDERQPFAAAPLSSGAGPQGSSGPIGALGSSGASGRVGYTGSSGASGPTDNQICSSNAVGKRRKRGSAYSTDGDFGGPKIIASTDLDLTSYLSGEQSSGLVQLSVYRGSSRAYVAVGSGATPTLLLRQFSKGCASPESVFDVQRRNAYTISPDGLVTKVAAFTIEHVRSRRYIVADVLENAQLNVTSGKAALLLKPESNFDDVLKEQPDYRYFVRYVTTLSDGSKVATYCSLFFRNYCIWPASTCSLSLRPIDRTIQSTAPSDVDPTDGSIQNFYNTAKQALKLSVYPKLKMDSVTVQYV